MLFTGNRGASFRLWVLLASLITLQIIGAKPEEGNGGQIRATLLSNRATTRTKVQQYSEALEDISTSLDLNPESYKALRTRARIRLHLEEYEGSVADFKQSLEMARDGREAVQEVRSLQEELRKAEAALKRSKTKDYYKILGQSGQPQHITRSVC